MLGVVLILVYFIYNQFQPVVNSGAIENLGESSTNNINEEEEDVSEAEFEDETMEETDGGNSDEESENDYVANKMRSRNSATDGQYKKHSFIEGDRSQTNGPSEWENQFNSTNDVIGGGLGGSSDEFEPADENEGGMAPFKETPGVKNLANQEQDINDVMNSKNLMPGEVKNNFFEVMDEPVSVKNHHLVSVTRPIGVNTQGTSNRNMSYDIRGDEANPRFNVGPFLNSSIEANPYPSKLQMA